MSEKIINIDEINQMYPTIYNCIKDGNLTQLKELCMINRLSVNFLFSLNQDNTMSWFNIRHMERENKCIYDSIMNNESIHLIKSLSNNYGYSLKLFFKEK